MTTVANLMILAAIELQNSTSVYPTSWYIYVSFSRPPFLGITRNWGQRPKTIADIYHSLPGMFTRYAGELPGEDPSTVMFSGTTLKRLR